VQATSAGFSSLAAYEPGYYICLGGAAVVVFAGLWGAFAPLGDAQALG
jgi:hypothetical protein